MGDDRQASLDRAAGMVPADLPLRRRASLGQVLVHVGRRVLPGVLSASDVVVAHAALPVQEVRTDILPAVVGNLRSTPLFLA